MNRFFITLTVAFLFLDLSSARAQNWTGNANLFLGSKTLENEEWTPAEDHTQFGILVDFGKSDWTLNIAADVLASNCITSDGRFDYDVGTIEINLGVRRAFGKVIRPYLGAGPAIVSGYVDVSMFGQGASDRDTAVGLWLNGGVFVTIGNAFNVGLDFRYSTAKARLFDHNFEIGGTHIGLALGYHW